MARSGADSRLLIQIRRSRSGSGGGRIVVGGELRVPPAEPAVSEQVDESPVGRADRGGESVDLVGVEEEHLGLELSRGADTLDRVGGEMSGVDGEGEHVVEGLAGLTDAGGAEP